MANVIALKRYHDTDAKFIERDAFIEVLQTVPEGTYLAQMPNGDYAVMTTDEKGQLDHQIGYINVDQLKYRRKKKDES